MVNNILDGGPSGYDIAVGYWQLPGLRLNTFAQNYNLAGTALREAPGSSHNWRPGYEDVVRFTPTTTGWYRIVTGSGNLAGKMEVYAPFQAGDNVETGFAFSYRARAYTTNPDNLGDISVTHRGSYPKVVGPPFSDGGAFSKIRIGSIGTLTVVDIFCKKASTPAEVTVRLCGIDRGQPVDNVVVGASTPTVVQEFNLDTP